MKYNADLLQVLNGQDNINVGWITSGHGLTTGSCYHHQQDDRFPKKFGMGSSMPTKSVGSNQFRGKPNYSWQIHGCLAAKLSCVPAKWKGVPFRSLKKKLEENA